MAQNDEFIREVDEEYRRDQLAKVWERYNGIIIAVVVLVVAGVGGWRFWQYREQNLAQEAAVRYEEALRLSSEDKGQEAQAALENVMKEDAGTGYALLARFRLAAELGKQNAENGASAYDADSEGEEGRYYVCARALEGSGAPARRVAAPRHRRAGRPAPGGGAAGCAHQCLAPFGQGTLGAVRP